MWVFKSGGQSDAKQTRERAHKWVGVKMLNDQFIYDLFLIRQNSNNIIFQRVVWPKYYKKVLIKYSSRLFGIHYTTLMWNGL